MLMVEEVVWMAKAIACRDEKNHEYLGSRQDGGAMRK
jgi:hypothetical protein